MKNINFFIFISTAPPPRWFVTENVGRRENGGG
jgi:hypothetical protein